MTDIPHHDEQGTRDRPWDYIAHFDPAGVAAALARWVSGVWPGPRPRLLARIVVQEQDGHAYPLSNDADDGERQREALLAAAARFGMRVALPPRAAPQEDCPARCPRRNAALERRRCRLGRRLAHGLGGTRPRMGHRRRVVRRGVPRRGGRRGGAVIGAPLSRARIPGPIAPAPQT